MEQRDCPCGKGYLIKNIARDGQVYYKCPGSLQGTVAKDCKFFSFWNELKPCVCRRGYCRNAFDGSKKYWVCCVQGAGACPFRELITKDRQSSQYKFPRLPPRYQSSGSQPCQGTGNMSSSSIWIEQGI